MDMIHQIRGYVLPGLVTLALGFAAAMWLSPWFAIGLCLTGPLVLVGLYDVNQTHHSLLRNYPVIGHLRFLLEGAGPELHQYFVESNTSGRPFSRDYRALIYERAKNIDGVKPFGTELDVYESGYGFIGHSISPAPIVEDASTLLRVEVGGPDCQHPYSSSLVNISAMSFGALSAPAIRSLNSAAKRGGFAHNTGEGGLSVHHREPGGDVIWQIGTGYFGCRTKDGHFDADQFEAQARLDQVKMIELKVSQGAKPGHGGILPGAKVTEEIANARGVAVGVDCMSPPGHSAFSTPIELCEFIAELRERSGHKPVGFKLCVGDPCEFHALGRAMLKTGIVPDFITVDGGEGGTGAAPQEYSDHLGMPLLEGLLIVHNTMVGIGLRDRVRIAASGQRSASHSILTALALGADWVNMAREFMMSVGCIQSQTCHNNRCPVGVATQDPRLQRALVIEEKSERAYLFHRNTLQGLAEMTAACGLDHPGEIGPSHIYRRIDPHTVGRLDELYEFMEPGQLLEGNGPLRMQYGWDRASAESFRPVA